MSTLNTMWPLEDRKLTDCWITNKNHMGINTSRLTVYLCMAKSVAIICDVVVWLRRPVCASACCRARTQYF